MASEEESSCIGNPNFAVVCSFLDKFGAQCGLKCPDYLSLQEMLENTQDLAPDLITLHIKLLRRIYKSVSLERWEKVLTRITHRFSSQDAWEIERFGYKKSRTSSKVRVLKNLLEMQFDHHLKFKSDINKLSADELRSKPIGRDKNGHSYWYLIDELCQIRVYREDPDEETFILVAKDREGLVQLISQLSSGGDIKDINEDSNSLGLEKPITDTGQISSSTSVLDESSNGQIKTGFDQKDESTSSKEDIKETIIKPPSDDSNSQPEKQVQEKEKEVPEPEKEIDTEKPVLLERVQVQEKEKKEEEVKIPKIILSVKNFAIEKVEDKSISDNAAADFSNKKKKIINELVSKKNQNEDVESTKVSSLSEPPVEQKSIDNAIRLSAYQGTESGMEDSEGIEEEEEEINLPEHMKRPRLDRPTLLSKAKKKSSSEEEEEEFDDEEISEPIMYVRGEGSGKDCNSENTLNQEDNYYEDDYGEAVEEPMMFFYGEGSGFDCETGNQEKDEKKEDNASESTELVQDAALRNSESSSSNITKLNDSSDQISKNETKEKTDNAPEVSNIEISEQSNTQNSDNIDVTDSCSKEKVKNLISKFESVAKDQIVENEPVTKKPMFFFGPNSLSNPYIQSSLITESAKKENIPQTEVPKNIDKSDNLVTESIETDDKISSSNQKDESSLLKIASKDIVSEIESKIVDKDKLEDKLPVEDIESSKNNELILENKSTTNLVDESRKITCSNLENDNKKPKNDFEVSLELDLKKEILTTEEEKSKTLSTDSLLEDIEKLCAEDTPEENVNEKLDETNTQEKINKTEDIKVEIHTVHDEINTKVELTEEMKNSNLSNDEAQISTSICKEDIKKSEFTITKPLEESKDTKLCKDLNLSKSVSETRDLETTGSKSSLENKTEPSVQTTFNITEVIPLINEIKTSTSIDETEKKDLALKKIEDGTSSKMYNQDSSKNTLTLSSEEKLNSPQTEPEETNDLETCPIKISVENKDTPRNEEFLSLEEKLEPTQSEIKETKNEEILTPLLETNLETTETISKEVTDIEISSKNVSDDIVESSEKVVAEQPTVDEEDVNNKVQSLEDKIENSEKKIEEDTESKDEIEINLEMIHRDVSEDSLSPVILEKPSENVLLKKIEQEQSISKSSYDSTKDDQCSNSKSTVGEAIESTAETVTQVTDKVSTPSETVESLRATLQDVEPSTNPKSPISETVKIPTEKEIAPIPAVEEDSDKEKCDILHDVTKDDTSKSAKNLVDLLVTQSDKKEVTVNESIVIEKINEKTLTGSDVQIEDNISKDICEEAQKESSVNIMEDSNKNPNIPVVQDEDVKNKLIKDISEELISSDAQKDDTSNTTSSTIDLNNANSSTTEHADIQKDKKFLENVGDIAISTKTGNEEKLPKSMSCSSFKEDSEIKNDIICSETDNSVPITTSKSEDVVVQPEEKLSKTKSDSTTEENKIKSVEADDSISKDLAVQPEEKSTERKNDNNAEESKIKDDTSSTKTNEPLHTITSKSDDIVVQEENSNTEDAEIKNDKISSDTDNSVPITTSKLKDVHIQSEEKLSENESDSTTEENKIKSGSNSTKTDEPLHIITSISEDVIVQQEEKSSDYEIISTKEERKIKEDTSLTKTDEPLHIITPKSEDVIVQPEEKSSDYKIDSTTKECEIKEDISSTKTDKPLDIITSKSEDVIVQPEEKSSDYKIDSTKEHQIKEDTSSTKSDEPLQIITSKSEDVIVHPEKKSTKYEKDSTTKESKIKDETSCSITEEPVSITTSRSEKVVDQQENDLSQNKNVSTTKEKKIKSDTNIDEPLPKNTSKPDDLAVLLEEKLSGNEGGSIIEESKIKTDISTEPSSITATKSEEKLSDNKNDNTIEESKIDTSCTKANTSLITSSNSEVVQKMDKLSDNKTTEKIKIKSKSSSTKTDKILPKNTSKLKDVVVQEKESLPKNEDGNIAGESKIKTDNISTKTDKPSPITTSEDTAKQEEKLSVESEIKKDTSSTIDEPSSVSTKMSEDAAVKQEKLSDRVSVSKDDDKLKNKPESDKNKILLGVSSSQNEMKNVINEKSDPSNKNASDTVNDLSEEVCSKEITKSSKNIQEKTDNSEFAIKETEVMSKNKLTENLLMHKKASKTISKAESISKSEQTKEGEKLSENSDSKSLNSAESTSVSKNMDDKSDKDEKGKQISDKDKLETKVADEVILSNTSKSTLSCPIVKTRKNKDNSEKEISSNKIKMEKSKITEIEKQILHDENIIKDNKTLEKQVEIKTEELGSKKSKDVKLAEITRHNKGPAVEVKCVKTAAYTVGKDLGEKDIVKKSVTNQSYELTNEVTLIITNCKNKKSQKVDTNKISVEKDKLKPGNASKVIDSSDKINPDIIKKDKNKIGTQKNVPKNAKQNTNYTKINLKNKIESDITLTTIDKQEKIEEQVKEKLSADNKEIDLEKNIKQDSIKKTNKQSKIADSLDMSTKKDIPPVLSKSKKVVNTSATNKNDDNGTNIVDKNKKLVDSKDLENESEISLVDKEELPTQRRSTRSTRNLTTEVSLIKTEKIEVQKGIKGKPKSKNTPDKSTEKESVNIETTPSENITKIDPKKTEKDNSSVPPRRGGLRLRQDLLKVPTTDQKNEKSKKLTVEDKGGKGKNISDKKADIFKKTVGTKPPGNEKAILNPESNPLDSDSDGGSIGFDDPIAEDYPSEEEIIPTKEVKKSDEAVRKPLLTVVDISKLQRKFDDNPPENKQESEIKEQESVFSPIIILDNDSNDVIPTVEEDPLACIEEEIKTNEAEIPKTMTLSSFSLDVEEPEDESLLIPIRRSLRGRDISVIPVKQIVKPKPASKKRQREPEPELEEKYEPDTKRKKTNTRSTRSVDVNLRKSIEEQKNIERVSSDEEDDIKAKSPKKKKSPPKKKAKSKGRVKEIQEETVASPAPSSDAPSEVSKTEEKEAPKPTKAPSKNRTLLGLNVDEILPDIEGEPSGRNLRHSRRLAQQKIIEDAEIQNLEKKHTKKKKKGKDKESKTLKIDSKKKNKNKIAEEEMEYSEEDSKGSSKAKKKKRDKLRKLFAMKDAWKSSTDSSSHEEEEEEEVEYEVSEDEVKEVLKSDHEFSPESDIESVSEAQPTRRARTVKKESDTEEPADEHACQKCTKSDHPEMILLCDKCDCGWHCSCLRPALLEIPEGEWFCPPCQHLSLISALREQLEEYDKKANRLEIEERRKQRLAYVGISLDNVLPTKDQKHEKKNEEDGSDEDSSDSGSSSRSGSSSDSGDSDEPIYQLRQRRQAHSYRFNDYDELINSAIQDEMEAEKGAGNLGRGKDIATIVNAEKEEQAHTVLETQKEDSEIPPVVPVVKDIEEVEKPTKPEHEESEEELRVVPKQKHWKKKHRKLNCLDVNSEDEVDSDESFKGDSASDEEDLEEDIDSDDDSDEYMRGKRRGPTRRSTRARVTRYDREFIDDDSDNEDVRKRKKKSIWDESESEESDKSWGRKGKSKRNRSPVRSIFKSHKKSKKKKRKREDSDGERPKKKRPRIIYGGLDDSEDEVLSRRTRGKRMTYVDTLGSDSEEENKKPSKKLESEDEYVADEEIDEDIDEVREEIQDEDEDLPIPEKEEKSPSEEKLPSEESEEEKFPPVVPKKIINLPKLEKIPKSPRARGRGRGFGGPQRPQRAPKITITTIIPPPSVTESNPPDDSENSEKEEMEEEKQRVPPLLIQIPEKPTIPADIPSITDNTDDIDDEDVVQMMESEEYANKQLELMAIQLAREKKRRELEAQQEKIILPPQPTVIPVIEKSPVLPLVIPIEELPQPKKRGRRKKFVEGTSPLKQQLQAKIVPPMYISKALITPPPVLNEVDQEKPIIPQENIQVPTVVQDLSGSPPKRRGRGKGKKTLAAEAAAASGGLPLDGDSQTSLTGTENTNISTGSADSNPATASPDASFQTGKLAVATPPQPFSQSQPTPSVITRMLQSQPLQNQPFTTAANAMNQKYFGSMDQPRGPPPQFTNVTPRGRVPSPYRQNIPSGQFPPTRAALNPGSPHRLRSPGPQNMQMFHSPHHPLDPSPSGGGHIMGNTPNRDRQSPLESKGAPTPPPQYNRPVTRFPGSNSSESVPGPSVPNVRPHLPFQSGNPLQSSSPPRAPGGNYSPYNAPPASNYHYGTYPPPSTLAPAEDALPPTAYQTSYPEPYNNPVENVTQSSEGSNSKPFDEEGSGEFGGLVSYFSSQREDDLDT